MDTSSNFEMMISETNFIAEHNKDDGAKTIALQALKMLNDESDFIVKDADGDAVIDDSGNKMLFVMFPGHPNQLHVFQYKKVVDGQATVLTEGEIERLRLYLAGTFDGEE